MNCFKSLSKLYGLVQIARIIFLLSAIPLPLLAGEISVGKSASQVTVQKLAITKWNASLKQSYFDESFDRTLLDQFQSNQEDQIIQTSEFALNLRGYSYHPNLLEFRLNLKPRYISDETTSSQTRSVSDKYAVFNYSGRFNFLRNKPYPFTVFFNKGISTVYTGMVERFVPEHTDLGVSFELKQPLVPVKITGGASSRKMQGKSSNQSLDDTMDKASINSSYAYNDWHKGKVVMDFSRQKRKVGRLDYAVVSTRTATDRISLSTDHVVGSDKKFRIGNRLEYYSRSALNTSKTTSADSTLLWTHSDKLDSSWGVNLSHNTATGYSSSDQFMRVKFDYKPFRDLDIEVGLEREQRDGSTVDDTRSKFISGVNYNKPFSVGNLLLSGYWLYEQSEFNSTSDHDQIYGEHLTMLDFASVPLSKTHVDVASVVVTNESSSEIYIEGLDYSLMMFGNIVEIVRRAGGAINAGQRVLVDYKYLVDRDAGYTDFSQDYTARLQVFDYVSLEARYQNRSQEQTSGGESSRQLTDETTQLIGFRLTDYPILQNLSIRGSAIKEKREMNLNSYVRTEFDFGFMAKLGRRTYAEVGGRLLEVDNENTTADISAVVKTARLVTNIVRNTNLSVSMVDSQDDGSAERRESKLVDLRLSWNMRDLYLEVIGEKRELLQGAVDREWVTLKATIWRNL